MPRKKHPFTNEKNGFFTKNVSFLAEHFISGGTVPYTGREDRCVRECAAGIAFMELLLKEHMKNNPDVSTYASLGLTSAIGILDYLRSGAEHDISEHIKGLRSPLFRQAMGELPSGPPRENEFQLVKKAVVIGGITAIIEKEEITQKTAIKKILNEFKNSEVEFTKDKIVNWLNEFRESKNKDIFLFKERILKTAVDNEISVLQAATNAIGTAWDVPYPFKNSV